MAGCEVTIEAPDPLGADLIAIELQRRGVELAREGERRIAATVPDRAAGDALAGTIAAIAEGSLVTVDGGAAVTPSNRSIATAFAIVVGPSIEKRKKWDASLRQVETQVARDAGRSVERVGASFAVRGFDTRELAAQSSAAVIKGLNVKLNFEDARVAVVPDAVSGLVINVEADRRELLKQVGYAAESACLLQIQLRDPAEHERVVAQLGVAGLRVAVCERRLVAGFSNAQDARAVVERLNVPDDAAVQITMATTSVFDLGSKLREIEDNALAREIPYMYWDATSFGS